MRKESFLYGVSEFLSEVGMVAVREEVVLLLVHDEHAVEVLGELGVDVELQDVIFCGQLLEIPQTHVFKRPRMRILLLFKLGQDVVVVLVE